jgi:hypothetical protein
MPRVVIRTGILAADGREEILSDYQCDCPDCPNTAERVIGVARELGTSFIVCSEHAAILERRASEDRPRS